MRFWQAFVTAEMAAGLVYADRYTAWLPHLAMEAGALAIGCIMWKAGLWWEKCA